MHQKVQSWSIIIFCFNEGSAIAQVIKSVVYFLDNINCTEREIIVVDDGSTDNSSAEIQKAKETLPYLNLITHSNNRGIGEALRSGYFNSTNENVVAIPADGQFDVNEMIPFASFPEKTIVSFYRMENIIYSLRRNMLSLFNKKVNKWFLGIQLKDVNWVKIYKLEELRKMKLQIKSSLIESEICSKLLIAGNKVMEVKSVYHQRTSGISKATSSKIVWQAMTEVIKLIWIIALFRFRNDSNR